MFLYFSDDGKEDESDVLETRNVNLVENCLSKLLKEDAVAASLLALLSQALPQHKSLGSSSLDTKQILLIVNRSGL